MIKILIIDDQDTELNILKSLFSSILYVFLIGLASNGLEAIAMVRQHHPDIVVMDIMNIFNLNN